MEKEKLIESLNQLMQERNDLLEKKKTIDKKLNKIYNETKKIHKKLDIIEIKENKKFTIDELLTVTDYCSSEMYNYRNKYIKQLTGLPSYRFSCNSIFVGTKHHCIKIALIKGDREQNNKIIKALELFLPHIKEVIKINNKKVKYIDIFDRDLHETRSIILIVENNKFMLYNNYSKEVLYTFDTLKEAVEKIADKFYYESIDEED